MKSAEAERLSQRSARVALLLLGQADQLQRQLGIVERRTPRQQPVLLEHGRDLPRK